MIFDDFGGVLKLQIYIYICIPILIPTLGKRIGIHIYIYILLPRVGMRIGIHIYIYVYLFSYLL